jgi:3-oxoacyl-(acyl-carrier-protein) synthase
VTAVTSRVGNCGAGAGIIDFVSAVLAAAQGWIPPLHNCRHPRRDFGLDFVIGQGRTARIDHFLTSGFTYGGQTAALVARRWAQ